MNNGSSSTFKKIRNSFVRIMIALSVIIAAHILIVIYSNSHNLLLKKYNEDFKNRTFNNARKETNEFFADFYKENNIKIEDLQNMDRETRIKIHKLRNEYCKRKREEGIVRPCINYKEVKSKLDEHDKKTDEEKLKEIHFAPKVAGF